MSGLCPRRFESCRRRFFSQANGFVAEWSKALDSSSSLHLKAWVRIPPEPHITTGLVAQLDSASDFESGGCRFESCRGRSFWWLGSNPYAALGSNPNKPPCRRGISSIGRVRRSQRRGTGIETRILQSFGTQGPQWRNWIAHQTSNLGVVGSNPTWGALAFSTE